ncbi:MAG: 16S rRNA (uracil(1498)-N(3))-methyltransferase [Gemmatimonadaceae bacterium]|nr:16S rRNA (uracil(1498)-N(3))-methyltransferase [Gemmatimonadaceae bacterium]
MVGVDREGVGAGRPTFVTSERLVLNGGCVLDEHAARHMRALRLDAGAIVALRDGAGGVAEGQLVRLTKSQAQIEVQVVEHREPLTAVHLLVPVADKDRMLWLAEKAGELACTSWRPVMWRRSRSVTPRGEGMSFQARVRARMESALAQSEGAWLPQLYPEANVERAVLAVPDSDRIVLDPNGAPLIGPAAVPIRGAVTLAIGPEGGIEADEMAALERAGFRRASLGTTILRFETAAIAAMAIVRTALAPSHRSPAP